MARRRFGPLVVSVVLGTLVLVARLGQVQLGQHEVWADEAAALVRVGRVVPYRRGEIRDARGRVLVADRPTYEAVFAYRPFRREHPLGQVTHALSAIELACVPLARAWTRLEPLALALVRLTPQQVRGFAGGAALDCGPLQAPALAEGVLAERRSRASDLSFYVQGLLDLERDEARELTRLLRTDARAREQRYVDLAARVRSRTQPCDAATVEAELAARLASCRQDLQHLAQLLAAERSAAPAGSGALDYLLERLEGWRAEVEDGAAGELFAEACGFEAGRVEARTLAEHLDLSWLGALLRWDEARLTRWLESERQRWLERMGLGEDRAGAIALDELLVEVELAPLTRARSELVLDAWTEPFLATRDTGQRRSLRAWLEGEDKTRIRPLEVLAELDDLFANPPGRDERPSRTQLFSFQDRVDLEADARDACEVLARAQYWPAGASAEARAALAIPVAERAEFWRAWRADFERNRIGSLRATLERETRERWSKWEERFQEVLALEFARLRERAGEPDRPGSAAPRLELAGGHLDRASERARYTLRDHGARSALVVGESPSYELVHLLTRRPARFAGFRVARTHDRVRSAIAGDPQETPTLFVPALIGDVRTPRLRDVYGQRALRRKLEELRRKSERTASEEYELEGLVGRVWRSDEQYGSDGIEGYFNPELAGRNGYLEERGLEQSLDPRLRQLDVAAKDGQALFLTVDSDLQRAALEVFEHPEADPSGENIDRDWLARPTGALVLMGVQGELHAMASYPDRKRGAGVELRDRDLERTMRLYTFQPPGSVMKPFAAAWALDRLELDPHAWVDCLRGNLPDDSPGYGSVHCNVYAGHGHHVDVHEALRRSCNSYFAWLGDTHYQPQDFLDMYAEFGFGQPSGVRSFGPRYGLREDGWRPGTQPSLSSFPRQSALMLACNGLGIPQTTVLQVARAYAALATGRLPEVRLAGRIGGFEPDPQSRALDLRPTTLERVRVALEDCANSAGGSAQRALSLEELGFLMAAKTGSADLQRTDFDAQTKVRKHTWLAGWFPAEAPRYVLVVFCDSTTATASHSAIWLARQFLRSPAAQAHLRAEGILR